MQPPAFEHLFLFLFLLLFRSSIDSVFTFLTSDDDVTSNPAWLQSVYGKPDSSGKSAGDAVIIAVDKTDVQGPGWVDVFYFFWFVHKYPVGQSVT